MYNGENFLERALEAILGQTFDDFEVVLADNASEDRTPQICQTYAARDSRIRYVRNPTDIGGARNHDLVLHLARGGYFKWCAHDDLIAPTYLERCVEILDGDPSIILCHSRTVRFKEPGERWTEEVRASQIGSPRPQDRFGELLRIGGDADLIYGLMRTDALRRAGGMGRYVGADLVAVVRLALLGRFHEVPEDLFFKRFHPAMTIRRYPDPRKRLIWWDPTRSGSISFPYWRKFWGYSQAVLRSPLRGRERLDCFVVIARWLAGDETRPGRWRRLLEDLKVAARRLQSSGRAAWSQRGRHVKERPGGTLKQRGAGRPSA